MSSDQLTPALEDEDLEDYDEETEDEDEDDDPEPLPAAEVIAHLEPHLADGQAIITFLCQFLDEYDLVGDLAEYVDERGFGQD